MKKAACLAIRKATSKRNMPLLEAFNKYGLCEEIVLLLQGLGDAKLAEIELAGHDGGVRTKEQQDIRDV